MSKINIDFLQANKTNYTASNRANKDILYIVLHYTGNANDKAKSNAEYFTRSNCQASAHYFVDDNKIYQSVLDKDVAWSVGGAKWSDCSTSGGGKLYGKANNRNSISIEMCNTTQTSCGVSAKTLDNTKKLVAYLMLKYNIPIENVIRHFDVNGKHCPMYFMDSKKWSEYKLEITKEFGKTVLDAINLYTKDLPNSDWSTKELMSAKALGITDATKPQGLATREQVAVMIYRSIGKVK